MHADFGCEGSRAITSSLYSSRKEREERGARAEESNQGGGKTRLIRGATPADKLNSRSALLPVFFVALFEESG